MIEINIEIVYIGDFLDIKVNRHLCETQIAMLVLSTGPLDDSQSKNVLQCTLLSQCNTCRNDEKN